MVTKASVDVLHDGLLLTRADQLQVQSAEWTVLVVIEPPKVDTTLIRNIDIVRAQLEQAQARKVVSGIQAASWRGRLSFLDNFLQKVDSINNVSPKREKRGWFDFMGQIGHTMFGLATDDSIEECRRAIVNTRKSQREIVHQLNLFTTVLNRTQHAAAWNEHQISQVSDFITNRLIPKLNQALTKLNSTTNRVYRLEKAFYFERVVATLEQVTVSYVRLMRTHARQKASLELGRLTEDILSPSQLQDILSQATSTTTYPVSPIQWYYEHAHIYPVGGEDTLIYRVKLPLVDGRAYNRYTLATWPVPYVNKGYSIQIMVDHADVGMSTLDGDMFHPTGCMGWRPMVCRTGPRFNAHRWSCPKALISGNRKKSVYCRAQIGSQGNATLVTEISYGEYVVMTWGETLETRCEGQMSTRETLAAGTYLVTVSPGCSVIGEGVTLTGLIECVGHVSVKAMRVLAPSILNITDIIPQEQPMSFYKNRTSTGDDRWHRST